MSDAGSGNNVMRPFLALLALFVSACSQYEYSQLATEKDAAADMKFTYLRAIQTCNGKTQNNHEACVRNVGKEIEKRYAARKDAFMTPEVVASIIATQILIEYSSEQQAVGQSNSQSGGNVAVGNSQSISGNVVTPTSSGRICTVPKVSKSISLSSFVVVTAVCR